MHILSIYITPLLFVYTFLILRIAADTRVSQLDKLHELFRRNKQNLEELDRLQGKLEHAYVKDPLDFLLPEISHLTARSYYPADYKLVMDYLEDSLGIMHEMISYDAMLHAFVRDIDDASQLSDYEIAEFERLVVQRERAADMLRALDVSHFSPVIQEEHAVMYQASLGCDARYDEVLVAMHNNDSDVMRDIIVQHERDELFVSQQARKELVSHWFQTVNEDTLLLLKRHLAQIEERM